MADQHNDNIPAVGNQIANDIPDIKENLEYHKDVFEAFVNSWNSTTATNIKPKIIGDADNDTLVQCEESSDEDVIRFDIGGTEQVTLQDGKFEPTTDDDVDLGSSSKQFKDAYIDGIGYIDTIDLDGVRAFKQFLYSTFQRGTFTYNGGTTAYTVKVTASSYYCKDKYCYWVSELTTSAIGTPAADTWYYLYLDYSGITSGTAITNSELLWSDTAPSWNTTYRQWMNGDDRCIFAVRTDGTPTNIDEFVHSDDYIYQGDATIRSLADLDTSYADVTNTEMPEFATKARVFIQAFSNSDADEALLRWRPDGATAYNNLLVSDSDSVIKNTMIVDVVTASRIFEVAFSAAGDHQCSVNAQGWYFPIGM